MLKTPCICVEVTVRRSLINNFGNFRAYFTIFRAVLIVFRAVFIIFRASFTLFLQRLLPLPRSAKILKDFIYYTTQ